ncbi:MAG: cation:proton antiporter [Synechococcus sp.]|uniref:cation:proton antiporter n=1 Tax=Synechococcus sp. PROS-9-1 TaxID=1968775 RepID=UPI000DFC418B|nr:cation:proton antiporter [Synechococcus sp. PROS-9-1]QNJ31422.1 putative Na+/H+ antiporter/ CPA2 family [Synechococcus sp. PROS-9-1]RCL57374.1 MAG: cation:proton antiporter [Synechococcus sp. MED-G68]|tara:strand:- start:2272 stop:4362 length:2091 start_codon:yes stop_codon:yes gene_type:complete
MAASLSHLMHHPLGIFAQLVAISVLIPPLTRRLRLPDLVGLLAAGVLVGPHVLHWIDAKSETITLLSDIGAIYLLFTVGLEIDLEEFNRVKRRSVTFGALIFVLGVGTGFGIGQIFGFPLVPSLLLGALMATHTPLGYPIVRSYGAQRDESVIVSVGSTIFTDIAALLLLAVALGLGKGNLTPSSFTALLISISVFACLVVLGIRMIGRHLWMRNVIDENRVFLAVLLTLFVASLGAELAGVEKIVGAFLAGLAVNSVLPEGKVKEQVIFVGGALFIPIFFIHLGLLLDLGSLADSISNIEFTALMLTGALGCKALAAVIAGRWFRYSPNQILLMWSLAMPKVAATLATAFIGFQAGLLDSTVLNAVLAVMVVTATLGPTLTTRSVVALMEPNERSPYGTTGLDEDQEVPGEVVRRPLKVLVPVANPDTELSLLKLAARLSQGEGEHNGQLLPLALVSPSLEEARGGLNRALSAARTRLNQAATNAEGLTATTRCLLRVDDDIAAGMSRSALEEGADLLLIGAGRPDPLRKWLLGDLVDGVCRTAHCPVVVANLGRRELNDLNQILVPIKDLSASAREQFELALRLLSTAPDPTSTIISLLHIHDPRFNRHERSWMEQQLMSWCPRNIASHQVQIKLLQGPGIDSKIHWFSKNQDLVILRSQRRRVAGLPIPASDRTSNLVHQLACPALMISDPLT